MWGIIKLEETEINTRIKGSVRSWLKGDITGWAERQGSCWKELLMEGIQSRKDLGNYI